MDLEHEKGACLAGDYNSCANSNTNILSLYDS